MNLTYDIDEKSLEAAAHIFNLITRSSLYASLTEESRRFIDQQISMECGIDHSTPMSALSARAWSNMALRQAAHELYFQRARPEGPVLGTFSFARDCTPIDAPARHSQTALIPVLNACDKYGLSGVIFPEFDMVVPLAGQAPFLLKHFHGLFEPESRKLKLKRTSKLMAEEIGLPGALNDPVKLSGKHPGALENHARSIGSYITKTTAMAKRVRSTDADDRLEPSRQHLSATSALRLLHAYSTIRLIRGCVSVGKFGELLKARWLEIIDAMVWENGIEPVHFDTRAVEAGWTALWSELTLPVARGRRRAMEVLGTGHRQSRFYDPAQHSPRIGGREEDRS